MYSKHLGNALEIQKKKSDNPNQLRKAINPHTQLSVTRGVAL
jgi:hypothetical protein